MAEEQERILTEEEKKNCEDMNRLCFGGISDDQNGACAVLRINGKLYSSGVSIEKDKSAEEFIKLNWHLYMSNLRCIEKRYGVVDELTGDFVGSYRRPLQ